MATGWRIRTTLQAEDDSEWCAEVAHEDDSSKPESSCLRAAERRLIKMEVMHMNGFSILVILWDFVKFFDRIRFDKLKIESDALGYDRRKMANAMMVHAAPKVLKMGKACGKMLP